MALTYSRNLIYVIAHPLLTGSLVVNSAQDWVKGRETMSIVNSKHYKGEVYEPD